MINFEYTDTFGGESNYSWVNRGKIDNADSLKKALRKARKELGLTGIRGDITMNSGDMLAWKPRKINTILFVSYEY